MTLSGRAAAKCSHDFRPVRVDKDLIKRYYGGATLRLVCCGDRPELGGEEGTGVLIDAEHGYVLTAAHVVKGATSTSLVRGSSTRLPGTATPGNFLSFKVVWADQNSDVDIALLQAVPETALQMVTAADISLLFPEQGRFFSLSYPKDERNKPNAKLQAQECDLRSRYRDSQLLVGRDTYVADSGSPLFDDSGHVIAIGVDMNDFRSAIYTPIARVASRLWQLPLTKRMTAFDAKLRARKSDVELAVELEQRPDTCTNGELLRWCYFVSQRRADYVSVTDLISCPVIRALENRDLNDAIDLLRDIAPSIVAGRAALKIGEREMAFGNSSDAISHLSAAVDLLSKISDDDAKVEAYIRIDEARAQLSLGKLRQDAALLKAASATAAAAALRAPEGPQKALALTFIGDAETALGSHGSAAKAYARAWALGFDAPWIKINWTVSATAAVDESLISRSVLDRGISKAPRTTDEAIRKLAEPVSREH